MTNSSQETSTLPWNKQGHPTTYAPKYIEKTF